MQRALLLDAFEKARNELIEEGHIMPSDSKCANKLSEIVSEDFPYGEKSFRKLYKKALADPESEIQIPRTEVLNTLAQYLGYENYRDFVFRNNMDEVMKTNTERKIPKNKTNWF